MDPAVPSQEVRLGLGGVLCLPRQCLDPEGYISIIYSQIYLSMHLYNILSNIVYMIYRYL